MQYTTAGCAPESESVRENWRLRYFLVSQHRSRDTVLELVTALLKWPEFSTWMLLLALQPTELFITE